MVRLTYPRSTLCDFWHYSWENWIPCQDMRIEHRVTIDHGLTKLVKEKRRDFLCSFMFLRASWGKKKFVWIRFRGKFSQVITKNIYFTFPHSPLLFSCHAFEDVTVGKPFSILLWKHSLASEQNQPPSRKKKTNIYIIVWRVF